MGHDMHLSKSISPQDEKDRKNMSMLPYTSMVSSLMYTILCARLDIAYAVSVVSRVAAEPGKEHWTVVKCTLKYVRRTKNMLSVMKMES